MTNKSSNARILVDLALRKENAFFKDQYGRPHVAVRLGNDKRLVIMPLKSRIYKNYLSKLFRENMEGEIVGEVAIKSAVCSLSANAEFDGETIPLHLRVAWGQKENKGCIYYDMTNDQGRIVEISREGWRIIYGSDPDVPILFKRHNQTPQVTPDRNYTRDIFDRFLDLTNARNEEHRLLLKEQADYQDCRINAYPALLSKAEEHDYEKGVNLNLFSPNILFIDLDTKRFDSNASLQRALKQILKNISTLLHDVKPLILWSGHGYHIIIPVNAKEALENFTGFIEYTTRPSKEFLQFAERFLSLNKADTANNPGFKSCLLRVPYTFNSECVNEGIDAEVRTVQQWDCSKPLPEIDNVLIEFQTFLVDKKLKAELEENKRKKFNTSHGATNILPYAERLLHMSIPDHRKFATSLILAPYFVNIQHLSDNEAFYKIKEWLLRCDKVKNLEPSVAYFDDYTRKAIKRARSNGIKSLKFQETLKVKNRELYGMLKEGYYN